MERLEAKRVKGHTYYLLPLGTRSRPLWTRLAEISRQTGRHRRGLPRDRAGPHFRRGVPVGTAAGTLAGSQACRARSASRPPLPQTAARTDHRSVPGHRRDQPSDQPSQQAIHVGLVLSNRSAATSPICFPVRLEFAALLGPHGCGQAQGRNRHLEGPGQRRRRSRADRPVLDLLRRYEFLHLHRHV